MGYTMVESIHWLMIHGAPSRNLQRNTEGIGLVLASPEAMEAIQARVWGSESRCLFARRVALGKRGPAAMHTFAKSIPRSILSRKPASS